MVILGFLAGLVSFAAWQAGLCIFRVEEGHRAALTEFGRALRTPDGKLVVHEPGLHFKRPWQEVRDVPVMEQRLELLGAQGGTEALTRDGTVLRVDSALRYHIDDGHLERWLFGIARPTEHATGLFTCLLRNEIAAFEEGDDGSYAAIRGRRGELSERIQRFCKERVGDRAGLEFSAVDLVDVLPPDELADALNAVMHARAEADAAYARAEAHCSRRVLAAEHGVEVARLRAEAAEKEIIELASVLAVLHEAGTLESYVDRRKAEVLAQSKTLFLGSQS